MERARGPMRPFPQRLRAGCRLDRRHRGGMVAVGVGDEDMRHGFAAYGVEERRDVGGVVRTGIDDGDLAAADDVAHRALEGERARIIAEHAPHAGHGLVDLTGREVEAFVEGNVVGHANSSERSGELPGRRGLSKARTPLALVRR